MDWLKKLILKDKVPQPLITDPRTGKVEELGGAFPFKNSLTRVYKPQSYEGMIDEHNMLTQKHNALARGVAAKGNPDVMMVPFQKYYAPRVEGVKLADEETYQMFQNAKARKVEDALADPFQKAPMAKDFIPVDKSELDKYEKLREQIARQEGYTYRPLPADSISAAEVSPRTLKALQDIERGEGHKAVSRMQELEDYRFVRDEKNQDPVWLRRIKNLAATDPDAPYVAPTPEEELDNL